MVACALWAVTQKFLEVEKSLPIMRQAVKPRQSQDLVVNGRFLLSLLPSQPPIDMFLMLIQLAYALRNSGCICSHLKNQAVQVEGWAGVWTWDTLGVCFMFWSLHFGNSKMVIMSILVLWETLEPLSGDLYVNS